MMTMLSTALLSLFTVLGGPQADGEHRGAHTGKHRHGNICAKLECTDAQKTKIETIRSAHRADTSDERAAAKALRAKLRAAKQAQPVDAALVASLQAERRALRESMREASAQTREEIKSVLTAEQLVKLEALRAERKAKRGKAGKRGKAKRSKRDRKRGEGTLAAGERRGKRSAARLTARTAS